MRQPRRQIFGPIPTVVGVGAGFAALDGHPSTNVQTGKVARDIQREEVAPEERIVRGLVIGAGADCQNLVRARPGKREFGLEYVCVGVRLHTLANGREAKLYIQAKPLVTKLGAGPTASARAEFQRLTRETRHGVLGQCRSRAFAGRWPSRNRPGGTRARLWRRTTLVRSKTVKGSRGSMPMWTLLGTRPVAALTELL